MEIIPIKERFMSKFEKHESGCWLWTAGCTGSGYGMISRGTKKEGEAGAHRVSWEIHRGPIPEGLFVLHKCDNPPCVNPEHLFLGTVKDNSDDMVRKGRGRYCAYRGEEKHNARLTELQVRQIRRLHDEIGLSRKDLATLFSATVAMIKQVVTRTTWRHVKP